MYLYSYLVADIALILIWLALFLWRKDVRNVMVFLSVLFGIAGVAVEYIYTTDWWRPLTITHTRIGIEDFLFGFWIAGIAAVLYEEIFKRKVYIRKYRKGSSLIWSFFLVGGVGVLFFGSFYFLHMSSFYASLCALLPTIFIMYAIRRDVVLDSIVTGILIVIVELFWFRVAETFSAGWVQHYWLFKNLSGITFLSAPLEDLLWAFLVGAYIGPLYEVWVGGRLVRYASKRVNNKIITKG